MFNDMSLEEIGDEYEKSPWRYTICCESRSNNFFAEIARFKSADLAMMCLDGLTKQYEQYQNISFTLDDIHAQHTLAEVLEAVMSDAE